mgnify:FL=1|tara:strand:+ start:2510 stop:2809 length:300 start_codon:yes stop_codon:yes gene_type:complete
MLEPSLLDVLKENEKISLDNNEIVSSIEEAIGFVKKHSRENIFSQLNNIDDLTIKEKSRIELAEIYIPLLARFKDGEIMDLLKTDSDNIKKEKKEKGIM